MKKMLLSAGPIALGAALLIVIYILLANLYVRNIIDIPLPFNNQYVCPGEYINCMPILSSEEAKFRCSDKYISWTKDNCPDFKSVLH